MTHNLLPGERLDELYIKGMQIIQNPAAPCFSIDAILLSDFVQIQPKDRIIDLGTGTGIIPLLLSAKCCDCQIFAVELMKSMADMASRSVAINHLAERIQILNLDLRSLPNLFLPGSFSVITSNPPYYKIGTGKISADLLRLAARSESFCKLAELFSVASYLLCDDGTFFLIHKADRKEEILEQAQTYNLSPHRMRMIRPYAERKPNLMLCSFKNSANAIFTEDEPLTIYDGNNRYSAEMKKIYQGR